jgi:hypothetical protein
VTDTITPLAFAGRALVLDPLMLGQLSEEHPGPFRELVINRWLANLFSPRWGELFTKEETKCKLKNSPKPN